MEAIDTTIINTAIPAISRSLTVPAIDLKIILISYLVGLAIFIPISGWLADKYGSKRIFILAISIFTLCSLWCGFASDLLSLGLARFLQGAGGGLALPVGRLIILRYFGRQHLIATMNHIVTIGAVGAMLGPLVGGIITDYFTWHWIFWINLPIGLSTIILAYYWLEKTEVHDVHALDKTGFILFAAAFSGIIFGFSALSQHTININLALIIILIALILFIFYLRYSRHQPHPIIKSDLLKYRTFRLAVEGNLISRLGFGSIPFLLPLDFQIGLGKSALISGLLLVPTALGVLVARQLSLSLLGLLGYKRLLLINTVCASFSIALFASIGSGTTLITIACYTFIFGFLTSLQYSFLHSLAYTDLRHDQLSAGTSVMSTAQQFAKSLAIAAGTLLVYLFSFDLANSLNLRIETFHYTFLILAMITLISSLIFTRLEHGDGHQMISGVKR
ncbi:MAG: MFS transporter [Tatlockia sp.]|nr:MFS transporter [Tatlockia sp.]